MPSIPTKQSLKHPGLWLAALILTVLGAKLWLIELYGSPIPFWDQWYEADWLFKPWLEGGLTWKMLFAAHNEHRIFFTRVLDLGVIWLNGRWDTLLQMTVNAFIHTVFVCGLAYWLWDFLGRKNGCLVCLLLAPFFALPYAAENTLRGFDSGEYFLNISSLATLAGLGFGKPGGRMWWLGLAAGIAGLFTMGSSLLAPVAVCGLLVLRAFKHRRFEKMNLITLAACLGIIGLGTALSVTVEQDRQFRAGTFSEFLAALTRNLMWPFLNTPEMLCVIVLPLVLLAVLYFRPDFQELRGAEFLLVFGLWGFLQSAALAYGRANLGDTPASRYMDVLNVFAIASLFATLLLSQSWSRGRFPDWAETALPLLYAAVIFSGVFRISQRTADDFLIPNRMGGLVDQERIEKFWSTGRPEDFLEQPGVRPDPEMTLRLLRDPKLQAVLPVECLPPDSPHATGWLTAISRWLLRSSTVILTGGLILFAGLCGCELARKGRAREKLPAAIALLVCVAALGFLWSKHSLRRETVEYEMQRELAAYFKSVNNPGRAATHERKADALKNQ